MRYLVTYRTSTGTVQQAVLWINTTELADDARRQLRGNFLDVAEILLIEAQP
jgi:hypothetical protein